MIYYFREAFRTEPYFGHFDRANTKSISLIQCQVTSETTLRTRMLKAVQTKEKKQNL